MIDLENIYIIRPDGSVIQNIGTFHRHACLWAGYDWAPFVVRRRTAHTVWLWPK